MNPNPYLALGVRPFINCCSVRTMHGGSLMLPQVRDAMTAASRQFVNLDELMEAAGQRLAELTGAEWGIVTCGSAAAVALGTAACVAGNDPVKMLRLPFTDGMVNRVLIPKTQRFAYDQAVRMIGCHLVEIAAVVKPRGIPIMVDAASEHLERPSPWLVRGADLVVYSGGKFLRGPQTSGLLLGSKPLVEAAWRNASPHQALGRPMKVSKEDVVGVLTALEYWFEERDQAAEKQKWGDDLAVIAERVARMPLARGEVIEPEGVDLVPRLRVSWDRWEYPLDGLALREHVLDGEPRIMLDDNSATEDSIVIDPFQLQPGEAAQVGDAISAVLREARSASPVPRNPPAIEISGNWQLRVDFLQGSRDHRLEIEQRGPELTGHQRSLHFEGPVSGQLSGDLVQLSFTSRYEASTICYFLDGAVHDGVMSGTAVLGAASDQNHGIVNRSQFGTGRWRASRVA